MGGLFYFTSILPWNNVLLEWQKNIKKESFVKTQGSFVGSLLKNRHEKPKRTYIYKEPWEIEITPYFNKHIPSRYRDHT